MTWSRLDTVAPGLSADIQRASPAAQRSIALAIARHALIAVAFRHSHIDEVLASIHVTPEGTISAVPSLDALVDALDDAYFTLADPEAPQPAPQGAVLEAFSRARAVSSLAIATGQSSLEAALESAYEAHAATEDLAGITAIIRSHGETHGAA